VMLQAESSTVKNSSAHLVVVFMAANGFCEGRR
jgi:hypothetical protein